jgi:hypothetical protein
MLLFQHGDATIWPGATVSCAQLLVQRHCGAPSASLPRRSCNQTSRFSTRQSTYVIATKEVRRFALLLSDYVPRPKSASASARCRLCQCCACHAPARLRVRVGVSHRHVKADFSPSHFKPAMTPWHDISTRWAANGRNAILSSPPRSPTVPTMKTCFNVPIRPSRRTWANEFRYQAWQQFVIG